VVEFIWRKLTIQRR